MAENLGKTVQELLTGKPGPLSHSEFIQWYAYHRVKNSKEEQAARRNRSGRKR